MLLGLLIRLIAGAVGALALSMQASSPVSMWDAANGVFVGDRAAGGEVTLPSPLRIFGYGSLVWRPESGWETFERSACQVSGWRRCFAQRSTDHRGTPEKPGIVCTLLPDAALEQLDARRATDPPSTARGVCYTVPDEQAAAVLDALDFREKGGYTRVVVRVTPVDGSPSFEALVYSATVDNPNLERDLCADTPEAREAAARVIATAAGPSGPNCEYLFQLAEALGDSDDTLRDLCARVRAVLTN